MCVLERCKVKEFGLYASYLSKVSADLIAAWMVNWRVGHL
jgi:hypothetical protein